MTAKVLIIEDDGDLRRGLNLRLRANGYQTALAEDAVTATMVAARERPDVILLDLGLPGGDGYMLMERFQHRSAVAGVPIIVLTGRDPAIAQERCRELGAMAFLQKPADNEDLLSAITSALEASSAGGVAP